MRRFADGNINVFGCPSFGSEYLLAIKIHTDIIIVLQLQEYIVE